MLLAPLYKGRASNISRSTESMLFTPTALGLPQLVDASPAPTTDVQEQHLVPPLQTAGFGNIGLSLLSMFQAVSASLPACHPGISLLLAVLCVALCRCSVPACT